MNTRRFAAYRSGVGDSHSSMRGFTRKVFSEMDLRCTGMEFASEFVIKASQLHAHDGGSRSSVAGQARPPCSPSQLSQRLAPQTGGSSKWFLLIDFEIIGQANFRAPCFEIVLSL